MVVNVLHYRTYSVVFRTTAVLFFLLTLNLARAATIIENFNSGTAPGWVFGGSAVLTSGSPDPAGQGWLRLTQRTVNNQFGYAYYNTPYATPDGFSIEFEFGAWGGSGADGFTVFLFNGANTLFNMGDAGGSLGYANGCGGIPGLSEAYIGIAFDEFGNFSNQESGTRCKIDGPGQRANSVTIRGPAQTNYNYLTHNQLSTATHRIDCPSSLCGTTRPSTVSYYRQIRILMLPTGSTYSVTVYMRRDPLDDYEVVVPTYIIPEPIYPTVKIGFAGTTGGSTNVHEVRNLRIDVFESYTDLSISGGFVYSLFGGSATQYRADVTNNGPNPEIGPIQVVTTLPTGLTYNSLVSGSSWSCTPSGQVITCSHPGPLLVSATLPSLRMNVDVSSGIGGQTVTTTSTVSGQAYDFNATNNTITTSRYVYGAASSGTKNLYAYFLNSGTGTTALAAPPTGQRNTLQRRRPGSSGMPQSNTGQINGGGSNASDWLTLTPDLTDDVVIPGGQDIEVSLCILRIGGNQSRSVRAEVRRSGVGSALGISRTFNIPNTTDAVMETFGISLPSSWTITAANPLQMRVINQTGNANRHIRVYSSYNGCGTNQYSRVDFYTNTVINVDTVEVHDVAWPATNAITSSLDNGATIYVRASLSDPFGSFDITDAVFAMYDNDDNLVAGPSSMTQVDENTGLGQKTYEISLTVPSWSGSTYVMQVTGEEGIEGTIDHANVADFVVNPQPPMLMVTKLASSLSVNPGSVVNYIVQVSNAGTGDATSVEIRDTLARFITLGVDTYGPLQAVEFVDGTPPDDSGLIPGPVVYSDDDGATWLYTPVSGGGGAPSGYDANITRFRIPFTGSMPPGSSFSLHYDVLVD